MKMSMYRHTPDRIEVNQYNVDRSINERVALTCCRSGQFSLLSE